MNIQSPPPQKSRIVAIKHSHSQQRDISPDSRLVRESEASASDMSAFDDFSIGDYSVSTSNTANSAQQAIPTLRDSKGRAILQRIDAKRVSQETALQPRSSPTQDAVKRSNEVCVRCVFV